ncbi:MAG TPA: hypothetical protein VHB48_13880 [Chitinophagaceae bacterium]|nr:hypothetical protein [Chitinophagaceae bacterium]
MKPKTLLLGVLLICGATCYSQDSVYTFKKQWPVYACFMGAGLSYGTAEALVWHVPDPNSKFWNPYLSYKTNRLIDGYHAARAVGISFFVLSATLSVNDLKHPFRWAMLKKMALCGVSYWAGQQLTWHLIRSSH